LLIAALAAKCGSGHPAICFLALSVWGWWSPVCATDLWCVLLLFYEANHFFFLAVYVAELCSSKCLLSLLQAAAFFDVVADIILQECLFLNLIWQFPFAKMILRQCCQTHGSKVG